MQLSLNKPQKLIWPMEFLRSLEIETKLFQMRTKLNKTLKIKLESEQYSLK